MNDWSGITYPNNLPISNEIDNIKQLIASNQVVIVCGETGSGKTTQLPKIFLQLGYTNEGYLIGHTQPRRVAAKSIAHRISQELNNPDIVGYKVRFNDKTKPTTAIKLMTDGILLQEIQKDRNLKRYSALIIDEAHERSLNIDFILGYLKSILSKRPDLKIIVTSATIDNKKLSGFFNDAPIIDIEGKTYPVDVIFKPFHDSEKDTNLNQAIYQAVSSCLDIELGNVLVFLPGEREIKDCISYLRKTTLARYDLLALFSRQNEIEQNRVFAQDGKVKIIVTTNVAETSLTIPGVKFVVDSGLAKVKRYNVAAKVEQLLPEPISQASSKQRTGRAGRLSHGMCIRLFSEEDFNLRRKFSEPEILRSNLANVILKLIYCKLGDPVTFPFLDVPENKAFNDGFRTLLQLQAIKENKELTKIGWKIAQIPIDVSLARILIAAGEEFNCLKEALIIVSFLGIIDPREVPLGLQEEVKEKQELWQDKESEFITILNLWDWFLNELIHKKSNKKLQEVCYKHFLSFPRLREWQELHGQLKEVMFNLGYRESTIKAEYKELHSALLTGLLNNIGQKDIIKSDYIGCNGKKFIFHPSSEAQKANWIVSAAITQTARLYARVNAKIDPEWLVPITRHLVKYNYSDPRWDKKRGEVVAIQKVLLYGLIISQKKIAYNKINLELSREIFIRDGLVRIELLNNYSFIEHNLNVLKNIEEIEDKLRISLMMVDDEVFEYYNKVIPLDIADIRSFDLWVKDNGKKLYLNQEELINKLAIEDTDYKSLYPEHLVVNNNKVKLEYIFDPNHVNDGVTAIILLNQLNQIDENTFTWLVPGMIRERVSFLIKALPKKMRIVINPLNEFITKFLNIANQSHNLHHELSLYLAKEFKLGITSADLEQIELPQHLRFHFQIVDNNQIISMGDDLRLLKIQLTSRISTKLESLSSKHEIKNIINWDNRLNGLLNEITLEQSNQEITGFLSLRLNQDEVDLTILADYDKAQSNTRKGILWLIRYQLQDQIKYLKQKKFINFDKISLYLGDVYNKDELLSDSIDFIIRMSVNLQNIPRNEEEFKVKVSGVSAVFSNNVAHFAKLMFDIAKLYHEVKLRINKHSLKDEIELQLDDLIFPGFLRYTKLNFLNNFPRYLQAILKRLDKYPMNKERDAYNSEEIANIYDAWYDYIEKLEMSNQHIPQTSYDFKYKIEELRVSLFANELKTLYPVSVKRLYNELEKLYIS